MKEFKEWLLGMEALFGWMIPAGVVYYIIEMIRGNEKSSVIRYCIAALLTVGSIVLYIICLRKNIKIEEEKKQKEEFEKQEREIRILSSPTRNLTPLQFEQFTAYYMKNRGYTEIQLTKKTNDFGADIIAKDPAGKAICVQCKKYSKPVGVKAVQEIVAARLHYGCELAAVAVSSCGYTKQAIELAKDNDVILYYFDDVKHIFIENGDNFSYIFQN